MSFLNQGSYFPLLYEGRVQSGLSYHGRDIEINMMKQYYPVGWELLERERVTQFAGAFGIQEDDAARMLFFVYKSMYVPFMCGQGLRLQWCAQEHKAEDDRWVAMLYEKAMDRMRMKLESDEQLGKVYQTIQTQVRIRPRPVVTREPSRQRTEPGQVPFVHGL